jgi:hypothetical protein
MCKGLCNKHYYQVKRGGTLTHSIKELAALRKCSIEGCGKRHFANNLCPMHNRRLQRHGDANYVNPKCNRDGKTKERRAEYYNGWLKENWPSQMAYRAARKARVKLATPKWADLKAISDFYLNCPKGHHVDHISPLHGERVSGLHVIDNLQYLLAIDNLKKSNKS